MGISAFGASGIKPGVCTSTTRPTAPYEGMMIYETDTDMVALWNGSAWRYIAATTPTNGTVLQIQTTNKTDTFSYTGTTYTDVTGLSVSIAAPFCNRSPITLSEPDMIAEPVYGNESPPPITWEADTAYEADVALVAVPVKLPVNEPVNP